ncbi:hypothetical protein E2562_011321 [Oryza meyeriana var. granulata]|uniref:At1g61320/AtMIF1 LRR domain-containing protein n=1 Tax=Oryza meyeriana var. granulata TaxID=110450 RepID=A0A6G1BX45_9ORYZ|nr:hypothetical protein E2562_011321 [Oryza meyeriana var. granulata]
MVVEELAIKFEFDTMLVDHLNDWVSFAISSWTKFVALDLTAASFGNLDNLYLFSFEFLDSGSTCCLQHMQLSFACLTPPAQFRGFPNLKKLDLRAVCTRGKDLEVMLSDCSTLEWLSIIRCDLYDDELKMDHPCPACYICVLSILSSLPNMWNLTLRTTFEPQKMPSLHENRYKFFHLKHLELLFFIRDVDVISLVSFLRAAPFIEKLRAHDLKGPKANLNSRARLGKCPKQRL